jgi:hypothetical protein
MALKIQERVNKTGQSPPHARVELFKPVPEQTKEHFKCPVSATVCVRRVTVVAA